MNISGRAHIFLGIFNSFIGLNFDRAAIVLIFKGKCNLGLECIRILYPLYTPTRLKDEITESSNP
jgi:hypothetical protein